MDERTNLSEGSHVDWDGIGTAAFFLSSGVVGVGVILLRAYGLRLKHRLEQQRLQAAGGNDSEMAETLLALQDQLGRLNDRMDFTERLLAPPDESQDEDLGLTAPSP